MTCSFAYNILSHSRPAVPTHLSPRRSPICLMPCYAKFILLHLMRRSFPVNSSCGNSCGNTCGSLLLRLQEPCCRQLRQSSGKGRELCRVSRPVSTPGIRRSWRKHSVRWLKAEWSCCGTTQLALRKLCAYVSLTVPAKMLEILLQAAETTTTREKEKTVPGEPPGICACNYKKLAQSHFKVARTNHGPQEY